MTRTTTGNRSRPYTAAVAGLNNANTLQQAALTAGQARANSIDAFLDTDATEAAQTEVTKDSDLEALLKPLRDAHSLLVAQTQRDSALRLAQEAKDTAYEQADAIHAGSIREINARKVLFDQENDAFKVRTIAENAAGRTKAQDDSDAARKNQVDTQAAHKTRTDGFWTIADPLMDAAAELDGIAQANSAKGLPVDLANAAAIANHYAAMNTATLAPWTANKKAIADVEKTYTHEIANHKNSYDKDFSAAMKVYRDKVAEAFDTHDTETIDAGADRSSDLADAAGGFITAVSNEEQTVANIIVPSEQNLADQSATFTKQILVAKAAARRDAEVDSANDLAAHVANWHATINSHWSDLKNDEAQADKINAISQAVAGFNLTDSSAGSMLSLSTTINALSSNLQLDEVGAWVGHANTTVGALTDYADNSADSTSETGDDVTDKTEIFDKGVNLADKVRTDDYSNNRKTHTHAFASAKAQYIKDEADADHAYWVAYYEANRVYNIAVNGVTDPAIIAAAASTRTSTVSAAVATKTAAIDSAGVTRRTTEGNAIKTKTVADAQAQATWVGSAGSAYTTWVGDVGTDTNQFASEMKGHGIGYTTTVADSAAGANETVADETHAFNTGSAGGTQGLNNSMAGFTATFNTTVSSAESTAASAKTGARGDYEVALHQDHVNDKTAADTALGSRLSQYQLDVANAGLTRAQAYAAADNSLVSKYGAANAALTSDLNAADTSLVSTLSLADKDATVDFSDAGATRSISFGDSGADLTKDGTTADLELGRALTAVGVTYSIDIAGAATGYANSVEAAAVTLATASGEAAKLLHIGENSAAAQSAADAILVPAQAAHKAALKTAGIDLAGDVGDAEITGADGSGNANIAHTGAWNGAVSNYTSATNGAETAYTNATNSALAGWVSSTVNAENADASAIAGAFQTYIAAIGQAEVDWVQDIGDADEDYAEDVAEAEEDLLDYTPPSSPPGKCPSYIPLPLCDPANRGYSGNAVTGRLSYLDTAASANVTRARAAAEAETDRNVAARQAEKTRDDALAAADKEFVDGLAAPTAAEANNSTSEGNNFASDVVTNTNGLISGVVGFNAGNASAHAGSEKQYDVDIANALKTYLVDMASLAEGADDTPVKEAYDEDQADATRDDKVRKANADYTRATGHITKAHKFIKDMASDGEDLSVALAAIERLFVTQVAPLIAEWDNGYAAAEAGQRTADTASAGTYASASAAAEGAFRAADYAAQSSALSSMNSSAPSNYLASMSNLASQRASWWSGEQASQLSNVAGRNAAGSAYAAAANAASLDDPAGNSAAERINAAGVIYAGTTSLAFKVFNEEVAAHLREYVQTVANATKTYADAKAGAERDKKIAIANADYSKAVDENFDYASALSTANTNYSNIVGPATDALETAKKTASEKRAKDDATSQKKVDEAVAGAEKTYAEAVAAARADESEDLADAAETHDTALASLESAGAGSAASSWAAQLANPSNATIDPWFELAEDIAAANSTRQSSTGSAASALTASHAAALESLGADLSTALVAQVAANTTTRETFASTRGSASVTFANQTGGNATAKAPLAFADEGGGGGTGQEGVPSLDDLAKEGTRVGGSMPTPSGTVRREPPKATAPVVQPKTRSPMPSSPPPQAVIIIVVNNGDHAEARQRQGHQSASIGAPEDPIYQAQQMKWGRLRELHSKVESGTSMTPKERGEYKLLSMQYRLHRNNELYDQAGMDLRGMLLMHFMNPENEGLANFNDLAMVVGGFSGPPSSGSPLLKLTASKPSLQLHGKGGAYGITELSPRVRDTGAINKQLSTEGKSYEFVFVTNGSVSAFGINKYYGFAEGSFTSPHQTIFNSLPKIKGGKVVGGIISFRNGKLTSNEHSGHYGEFWTSEITIEFLRFMKQHGIEIKHIGWPE